MIAISLATIYISSQYIYAETLESYTNSTAPDSLTVSGSILPSVDLRKYYTVLPGDENWINQESFYDKIQTLQISNSVIHTISDKELLDLCLFNPTVPMIFAFENPTDGLKILLNFNSYNEILNRKSSYPIILDKYIHCDYQQLKSIKTSKDSSLVFECRLAFIVNRYLLTKDEVIEGIQNSVLIEAISKSIIEYQQLENEKTDFLVTLTKQFDCYVMYKIMVKMKYEPLITDEELNQDSYIPDKDIRCIGNNEMTSISQHAQNFLKEIK